MRQMPGLVIAIVAALVVAAATVGIVLRVRRQRSLRAEAAKADRLKRIEARRELLDAVMSRDVEAAHRLIDVWSYPTTSRGQSIAGSRAAHFALGDDTLFAQFESTLKVAKDVTGYVAFVREADGLDEAWCESVGRENERTMFADFLRHVFRNKEEWRNRYASERAYDLTELHRKLVEMFHAEGGRLVAQIKDRKSVNAYIELQRDWSRLTGYGAPEKVVYWPADRAWNDLVDRCVDVPKLSHYRGLPALSNGRVARLASTALLGSDAGLAKQVLAYCYDDHSTMKFIGEIRLNELVDLINVSEPFRI